MAAASFFQINLVTSPFRAETTAASRTSHSEDLWPSGSSNFDSLLVPEQAFSRGAVESFDDCLVPLNLCAPTVNVSISLVTAPMNSRPRCTSR